MRSIERVDPETAVMRIRPIGLTVLLVFAGVCGGQTSKPPASKDELQTIAGKASLRPGVKDKADSKPDDRDIVFTTGEGTSYALLEHDGSAAFEFDRRLLNRPLRLIGRTVPGTKDFRVETVQTVKDGKAYTVDYWCDTCSISVPHPGPCYCCGEELVFRERLAK
jgi:hypothetical protein